ncbi:hypothetical protein TL08_03895 [Actinoalloteichus hymeniacidonis]|uniref:Peptidase U32 n=1 Tax=Actinoalloteichus hymeniacidonis TaxID=340345 RepID=A0AAC9HLQ7_9PSEU|nr:hypothetical protein TL08_03895 [Actinoalloteichus hymeniacidonis]
MVTSDVPRSTQTSPASASLARLGYPGAANTLPTSALAFPDGGAFRVEIPSVEGPDALAAVLDEAARRSVPIHRVSQGSGVMMQTDAEITDMVQRCAEADIELCLFLGPRASWDYGAGRYTAAGNLGTRARGGEQLEQSLEDALRAVELGVRCLLVGDEGVLWALHRLRATGELPADLTFKVSALIGPANPASFALFENLGADSVNVPGDLSLAQLSALRSAGRSAIDFYLESPDNLGGFIRHYDGPELVRLVAPVYLKFGLRNAPDIYPSGGHLRGAVLESGRERVRRAELGLALLERRGLLDQMSPLGSRAIGGLRRFEPAPESADGTQTGETR